MIQTIWDFLETYNEPIMAILAVIGIIWIFSVVDYDQIEDDDDFLKR